VKVDANSQLGESNENNNDGVSTVMVKKYVPPSPPKDPAGGWVYPLVVVVLLVVAMAVAYVLYQRRPKYDKELYESIYGRRDGGAETQMAADRAEVERRAREKGEEGYVPSPLYESTTHEESYPQPTGDTGSVPVTGPAMDMGVSLEKPPEIAMQAPPEMREPSSTIAPPMETPVIKPIGKKTISIRPVEKK